MNGAPLLSSFGGTLTTYRPPRECVGKLGKVLSNVGQDWTNSPTFPGGDFALEQLEFKRILRPVADLPQEHAERLFKSYGMRTIKLLDGIWRRFRGPSQREVDYPLAEE